MEMALFSNIDEDGGRSFRHIPEDAASPDVHVFQARDLALLVTTLLAPLARKKK